MKSVENKDTSIPSSMVDVDGEDKMINGAGQDAPQATRKDEEEALILESEALELKTGLIAKYAESAMNGILSSNVMRFAALSDLQDNVKKIVETSVMLAEHLVDEVFRDE